MQLARIMECGLNSARKKILDLLIEPVKLTFWKVVIGRITVGKFRMNDRGTMEVAVVLAVLKSRYGEIQRSSRSSKI